MGNLQSLNIRNQGSNLGKSQKKGFQIRALKNEEILGVVPIKVPVAQRQSVYNTVVSHNDSQESEMKMVIAS